MADNSLQNHKNGLWVIHIYNPAGGVIGPFSGRLEVTKDFHTVVGMDDDEEFTLATVPSQNVAYCVNTHKIKKYVV